MVNVAVFKGDYLCATYPVRDRRPWVSKDDKETLQWPSNNREKQNGADDTILEDHVHPTCRTAAVAVASGQCKLVPPAKCELPWSLSAQ